MDAAILENAELEPKYTHKKNLENVLVPTLLKKEIFLDGIGMCDYQSEILINKQHSFFFEHECAHVPGLMLIEGGRQNAMAIAHKFFNTSLSEAFVINNITVEFSSLASADDNVQCYARIVERQEKAGRLKKAVVETFFYQNSRKIAASTAVFTIFRKSILAKMESRH